LEQTVERDEMSACVQQYLADLPDDYRAVVFLQDMHGLTGPEIAETLGVSLATVKIRLHRARKRLRAALGDGCTFSRNKDGVLVCEPRP
jgi:RNA polymerase sigma-70 factor (ECF subfamily)